MQMAWAHAGRTCTSALFWRYGQSAKLATVASQLETIMLSGEFVRPGVIFCRLVKTSK
jgi:hypothetical protein